MTGVGNFSEALAAEVQRLRAEAQAAERYRIALQKVIQTPGNDVNRLRAIARDALEADD